MTIFTFMPDWLVAVTLMVAICVFVVGRVRLAIVLAIPAVARFLVWPALIKLIQATPPYVLVMIIVLALPVVIIRAVRMLLVMTIGRRATDHALGQAVGKGLIHIVRRKRF